MFIIWSTYWLWSIIDIHLRTRAAGLRVGLPTHLQSGTRPASSSGSKPSKASRCCAGCSSSSHVSTGRDEPFRSRAWYPWPFWPAPHLESICKAILPLLGVLIELYIGWGGWRPLYQDDGHFAMFHIGNWQHALMYGSFAISGVVDLIGFYTPLPAGTEQGFLTVAFLVETLLMGMHSKPNPLDNLVHMLLTGVMVACVVVCAAEIAAPNSLLLALLRPMVVFFQGTWFWHVGAIMFWDSMSWDMEDMGAVMMIPVVFCLHIVLICLGTFTVYLFLRWVYARAGITAKSSTNQHYQAVPQYPKQGPGGAPAFLHCESVDTANGSDQYLIESQLELADYPAHHASSVSSTGGGARDARSKGVHAM